MIKENGKEGSFIMKRSRKFLFVLACLLFVMAAGMCSIAPEKAPGREQCGVNDAPPNRWECARSKLGCSRGRKIAFYPD